MKRIRIWVWACCVFLVSMMHAQVTQQLTALQYFYDTDPGTGIPGNGAILPVTPTGNLDQTFVFTLPGSISNGLHYLYARVKDEYGRWSMAERRMFYVSVIANGTRNVTAYQYYFDNDPGVGAGGIVPVTSTADFNSTVAITVPNLSDGIHQLYIRVKDDLGRWTIAERRSFYASSFALGTRNIEAYQYYFDTDPGINVAGNGGIVTVSSTADLNTTVSISLPTLDKGIHQLYIRTKDDLGRWTIADRRMFYISDVVGNTIDLTSLEYYFDVDPGVRNANPIPITATGDFNQTIALGVPCLSTGTHYFYLRAKDNLGRWSIAERDTLTITSGITPSVVSPGGPLSICSGSSVILSTSPVPGVTYQWVESGVPIPGQTNPTLTVTTAGSYALRTICGSFVVSNTVVVTTLIPITYYADTDNDGYGNPSVTQMACVQPSGYVIDATDCNDTNASIHPGGTEVCNLLDDDCDGLVDEGVQSTFYADADNDGYGNAAVTTLACTAPSGYVANADDCNDTDASIHPGGTEVCNLLDDDCDGLVDEGGQTTFYADADNDGYGNAAVTTLACTAPSGYVANADDCNDTDVSIHPGGTEVCNLLDDDCDGLVDEGVQTTFYADADNDGYGNGAINTLACTAPSGYVANADDCNDTDASIHPSGTEVCNLLDDDCDGLVDEGVQTTFYADADNDGYGNGAINTLACTAPSGYVANADDCNDTDASIHPGGTEVCNLLDDDCDGLVDEGVQTTFYADADNDGYGNAAVTIMACSAPLGYVANDEDCDDNSSAVHPGATETCNLVDDDCDGLVDEGVQTTFYADADNDGYGNAAVTTLACTAPSGYTANADDCDDTNASIHPGGTEVCNLLDDDCDGLVDEGGQTTFYADADNDGYGNAAITIMACTVPSGYVANADDCNDTNASIHPGGTEVCNLLDDDCDGLVDEGGQTTFYSDADNDGYGNAAITIMACTAPSGYVANADDCNDTNASIHPGGTEVCNLLDDDCDGLVDEGVQTTFYADADNDGYGNAAVTTLACTAPSGYVANSNDCDDTKSNVHPGATETCNLLDDNCNGIVDEGVQFTFYADTDGDDYGNALSPLLACTQPAGYVTNADDCNDSNASIHPGGTEVCNLLDDDCDGLVDEGVQTTFYADADSDGYGNAVVTTLACTAPSGYVTNADDCNDTNASIHPGGTEVCNLLDDDCDGLVDEGVQTTFYADADNDGYGNAAVTTLACTAPSGYVTNADDCNDTNASIHPGGTEVCNLLDDDCDGLVDEGVQTTFYADADNDGYGNAAVTTLACTAPSGYVANSNDCDDTKSNVHPGATETCNLLDDNCNGIVDEGVQFTFYADTDGDDYGNALSPLLACTQPAGYVTNADDCNDSNASIHPGGTEVCNLLDDDCDGLVDEGVQTTFYADADNDGYGNAAVTIMACTQPAGYVTNADDCNDANASIHPGGTEVCNLLDDDCDGLVDEGVQTTFYADADNDGYGNAAVTIMACTQPAGYVTNADDCNDANASIHPGGTEVCNLLDDDCDGLVDEGVQTTFYADADNDGYGNAAVTIMACMAPSGYVANADDCNDTNASIHPGGTEICNLLDDDCDGLVDEGVQTTFYADADNDGYGNAAVTIMACTQPAGYVTNADDCNDANASIHPGGTEVCNLLDDDCDGLVDEGVQTTFYADADNDGYGNAAVTIMACTQPAGYVTNADDCNDTNASIHPGGTEVCNLLDDNCNGIVDEGVQTTFYADADNDGYGNAAVTTLACTVPSGYVANADDCNDTNASIHPGGTEVCNLLDDDCDGLVDEGVQTTFYADADNDGYGNAAVTTLACTAPSGYVANADDCNDTNASIHPGGTEICNLLDDDCDGLVDEGVQTTFYADADNDGYGNAAVTIMACMAPSGYVANADDCNDTNASIHPGETEICNLLDDDCDGLVDEGVQTTFYADADNDGYGNAAVTIMACTQPAGYVTNADDCNDTNASIHPGGTEVCNLLDDNCNGIVDEGVQFTFYADTDGDGYGNASSPLLACTQPAGSVTNADDCNDANASIHPGGTEVCNLLDDNCDGLVDEGVQTTFYADADNDGYGNVAVTTLACTAPSGYVTNADDCNDTIASIHPGGIEVCNLVDDDCDGLVDEGVQTTFYADADNDGYGNAALTTLACTAPSGYVANSNDCDDTKPNVHPGATETCNGIDDDCDGLIDEGMPDSDNDGICDSRDNCPYTYNPNQADNEGDGIGDVCDPNDDNDPRPDYQDCAPFNPTIYPGAPEICGDLIDNNCNNSIDDPLGILTILQQNVLCNGEATGLISVSGSCGLPPYTYVWDNGGNTSIISNLTAGPYKVTITDAQGLVKIKAYTITQPSALSLSISFTDVSCFGGNDGTATAYPSGGKSPYSYFWSNGSTLKKPLNFSAGTYTVTVTDGNSCTKTGQVTIGQPTQLEIVSAIGEPDPAHPGKYKITVTASGGTPYSDGYRYRRCNIQGQGCSGWQISNVLNNLLAGTYTVQVRDKNLCVVETLVTVGPPASFAVIPYFGTMAENNLFPESEDVYEKVDEDFPNENLDFTMRPNPGREYINLNWKLFHEGPIELWVDDLSGRRLNHIVLDGVVGENNFLLDMQELQAGMYVITLQDPLTKQSKIWVKMD